ncbi:glutamate receptor 2.7-like [Chenopodium quinoa]|uniref:glutamate receptor 2.7-like n=1 Tax=Chenopodium quinoa TaxID=63459 RepID=UPI000B77F9E2|nr:glutamate receptor 2.7-like [Chenopodium quinoa]
MAKNNKSTQTISIVTTTLFYLMIINFFQNNHSLKSQWLVFADAQVIMPVKIGVVLDMESMEGKIGLSCINMAISDFYDAHPEFKTKVVPHVRDSKHHDVLMSAEAVLDLLKNQQVVAIIGPQTSQEAQFVANLGKKAQVPIVSYSYTIPLLYSLQSPYFIRATQDDSYQVQPISDLIQAFGWREIVPVYVSDEFGSGIVPFLADGMQKIGTQIPYRSAIQPAATSDRIEAELYKLKSMSPRVFVVHMEASLGSRLFLKAKELGMMSEEYVWIITNAMADVLESLDPLVIQSMQGVLGVKTYVRRTRELEIFNFKWKMKFQRENPALLNANMNIHGLRAYDATIALAKAVEEVGITNFTFQRTNNAASNFSTDISDIGVSRFGQQLLQSILRSKFRGLGGNFVLDGGQLQSSAFELINVQGNTGKEIMFWMSSTGFVKNVTSVFNSKVTSAKSDFKSIVWPGNSTNAPKGWVISPNGRRLKIGVPVKNGFLQFVTVTRDPSTKKIKATGFCIDIFDAVMQKLPYYVPYDYVPFSEEEGQPTNSYDKLVSQVYLKKYDAVVGDVTIRAKRSLQVDFTFPFTESGVVMVVPVKSNKKIRAWLFVKPLTWDLWVAAFCSFMFIAFVVWVLEHRINEDFRGPPGHQAGTSLYYSFSTLVFSHSFNVFNNLTRFVVIVWVFVVLILIQSYTANLASLLTIEQLQPTIRDVNELIKTGESVAFQEGSFVKQSLLEMNFSLPSLKSYNTTDQLHELFVKGPKNGGIAAAFDELPFIKIFLAEYCSKYTMIPPTYKTDGFGFVFPKGSPLGSDVSSQVLNVTEGKEMTDIENKWFKKTNCPESGVSLSSNSLGLDSFWGLFTIAGAAALFALIISLASFLKEHQNVWSDGSVSVWTRIKTLMKVYDQKNLNSHTFRNSPQQGQNFLGTPSSSPFPQSPSSFWHNSERGFNIYEEQPIPSSEKMDINSSRLENSIEHC